MRGEPQNMLHVNVALVNLVLSVIGYPTQVASNVAGRWMFGLGGCRFLGFAYSFLSYISLGSLVVISFYRFCIICKPRMGKTVVGDANMIARIQYCSFYAAFQLFFSGGCSKREIMGYAELPRRLL